MAITKRKAVSFPERSHPFCEEIKKRMAILGYTQRQLAKRTGVSRGYLSSIIRGQYAVSVEIGMALCQVLEIDIELCFDYIYFVEHERIIEELRRASQEWYENMPDEVRERMMSHCQTNTDLNMLETKSS